MKCEVASHAAERRYRSFTEKGVVSMKNLKGVALVVCLGLFLLWGAVLPGSSSAIPAFDPSKIADMSGYDPATVTFPKGDTFKIGLMEAFSGPAAANGRYYWLTTTWNAYELNKRGGIMVDGKKKMIEVIKGDTQAKPSATKKEAEKLCLEDKVNVLWGRCREPYLSRHPESGGKIQDHLSQSHVPFASAYGR